jgi:hypothetical protein
VRNCVKFVSPDKLNRCCHGVNPGAETCRGKMGSRHIYATKHIFYVSTDTKVGNCGEIACRCVSILLKWSTRTVSCSVPSQDKALC